MYGLHIFSLFLGMGLKAKLILKFKLINLFFLNFKRIELQNSHIKRISYEIVVHGTFLKHAAPVIKLYSSKTHPLLILNVGSPEHHLYLYKHSKIQILLHYIFNNFSTYLGSL